MPKDKERTLNPAAAQRKADKQRALKKGKAAVAAQRNERLAHRNPDRLQRQIDDLKATEAEKGTLSQRDKTHLADLERDVARIRKAKEALGDKSTGSESRQGPSRDGKPRDQVLGKRGRSSERHRHFDRRRSRSNSSATDEDVRDIPMPRDTPPPISSRRHRHRNEESKMDGRNTEHALPQKLHQAQSTSQTVYESKPVLRDLRREAAGFVPSVVKKKLEVAKGGLNQPLMEEEDVERLEREGYLGKAKEMEQDDTINVGAVANHGQPEDEMNKFNREMRSVQIEEIEDEEA